MGININQLANSMKIAKQYTDEKINSLNFDFSGKEDTPIGYILAYMGTKAPDGYLICDGSIYNIKDYPELVKHLIDNFGFASFFGGDGETTFAVPDLRGEFLRGSGIADRNTGSGASVGIHQDPTLQTTVDVDENGGFRVPINSISINKDTETRGTIKLGSTGSTNYNGFSKMYTARPTNTSVLWCIKAKLTTNIYSFDEKPIGTWVDGKTIYRKVIKHEKLSETFEDDSLKNVNKILDIYGSFNNGVGYDIPVNTIGLNINNEIAYGNLYICYNHNKNVLQFRTQAEIYDIEVIVEYTKKEET